MATRGVQTRKPSLEVAPTTLAQRTPQKKTKYVSSINMLPQYRASVAEKRTFAVGDR